MKALAYYNFGRWVADCPDPHCSDAMALHPQHPKTGVISPVPIWAQVCANGHLIEFVAPDETFRAQVEMTLQERPLPQDRGWYPDGHQRAQAAGFPVGQSIDDLRHEHGEVASFRAAQADEKRRRLLESLSELGVEVGPDGTFHGQILKGD